MFSNRLFKALNISSNKELKNFSKKSKISLKKLKYYNQENILPYEEDRKKIIHFSGISEIELKLRLSILDNEILDILSRKSKEVGCLIEDNIKINSHTKNFKKVFNTNLGTLYKGDCLSLMETLENNSVNLIFADPPFNLKKDYESGIDDNLSNEEYLKWTEKWLLKCVDLLKEGGSLFIWNLPKWNTYISNILNKHLTFKNWIAVDIKYRLPIPNRLYPAHYGLLYYTKGNNVNVFNKERLNLETCRHCGGDIKDYGGYKSKLNTKGINLSDVWYDIPPVRHSKYKTRNSNQLSIKLLERIINLASNENDLIFDPFGGSGTTYITSEILKRRWVGIEIGSVDGIIDRFNDTDFYKKYIKDIQSSKNMLFTEKIKKIRMENGFWLPGENFQQRENKI